MKKTEVRAESAEPSQRDAAVVCGKRDRGASVATQNTEDRERNAARIAAAVLLALTLFAPRSSRAQGPLVPPGPPAPTMKTLQQIEPRTPITNTTAVTISASGSYYLTTNITVATGDAITITADNVTLDLNGFTVSSTAGSANGTGILIYGLDTTILNGHIQGGVTYSAGVYSGGGFGSGIVYITPVPSSARVAGVSVRGCLYMGIQLNLGDSSVIESCTVQTIGGYGLVASSVSHSTAYQCGTAAIYAKTASDCLGYATDSGSGLIATTANNCYGTSSAGTGLNATSASNCYGISSGFGDGVDATSANNCYGQSSGGIGLNATSANNCYGVSSGWYGLYAANTAIGCSGYSSGYRGLYALIANNCFGQGSGGYIGLLSDGIAIGCFGTSSGTGLSAYIANSCSGSSVTYSYHYNMPP